MKLKAGEKAWFPEEKPQYPCVLGPGENPPENGVQMLDSLGQVLFLLIKDASEDELDNADQMLRDSLQPEFLDFLPEDLIRDPAISLALLNHPAIEGSPLHEWKEEAKDSAGSPPMPQEEADKEMELLTLESFLANLL